MPELLSPKGSEEVKGKAQSAEDVNDIFKSLDNEEEPDKKEPKEEKTPKKEKELEEPDESEEETDDIELEDDEDDSEKPIDLKTDDDIDITAPPRKQEILKAYPELFKKFPFLEKMLYRDKQYSELFGSFDDAKEIAERAEGFKEFETQLLSGNTETILKDVKESDSKSFDKIVDTILPTIYKVDKEAYFHIVNGISKKLITEMAAEGKRSNNEDLTAAALLVNQFLYNTSEFTPHKNRVTEREDPEKKEVEEERLNFVRERFETSRDEMQVRVDNKIRATINEYIDQKGVMSPYVKKNAIKDAMNYLQEMLGEDASLTKSLNTLWRNSADNKFSRDSLSKIESTYLGRAKKSLKAAIIKAKTEAMKETSVQPKKEKIEEEEEETTPRRRGIVATGRPSQPKGKNEMKKGETVAEFLARD